MSLSDSNIPLVYRTILSILADLNSAVVCMVSIPHLISNFSRPISWLLKTVPSETISVGNTHSILHRFLPDFDCILREKREQILSVNGIPNKRLPFIKIPFEKRKQWFPKLMEASNSSILSLNSMEISTTCVHNILSLKKPQHKIE